MQLAHRRHADKTHAQAADMRKATPGSAELPSGTSNQIDQLTLTCWHGGYQHMTPSSAHT